jgi:hypothetical protein
MNRRSFLASAIAAILGPPLEPAAPQLVNVFTLEHLHSLKRQLQSNAIEGDEYVAFVSPLFSGRIGHFEGIRIYEP